MSIFSVSFFFWLMRVRSAVSRLRLLMSTWAAIFSAASRFSMKYISMRLRRNSVIASWMNLLVMAFFVWFS